MSAVLFFKRFLLRPMQVAYVVPSSPRLIRRVMGKLDLTQPRTIVEFGPGEGCHTREIIRRMHPDSQLLLFEIDPEFAKWLSGQFRHDSRIHVLNTDAAHLATELEKLGISYCDYVVSGIPFSYIDKAKKREILRAVHDSLAPEEHAALVVYQLTSELKQHAQIFPRVETEYCLSNFPPMFIAKFFKQALHGHSTSRHAANGHALNGHASSHGYGNGKHH
jgi:phospholipid N-methyltransferase